MKESKYIQSMIKKHGSYEAYIDFMKSIASKGGKKSGGTNWQRNPRLASQAASKGGTLGRRGWKYQGIINKNHVWIHNDTGATDTRPV